MSSTRNPGRVAGFLYLLLVTGAFNLIYVPGKLIVRDNAAATAANITAHETLFRLGIVSGLFSGIAFIFLAVALYRLFRGVNRNRALLLLSFVLVSAAIGFVNEAYSLGVLTLLHGAGFLSVFRADQLQAMAMALLRLQRHGNVINSAFWGLWLFPFGMLVYRSGFIPRVLGVWLIINGAAYVVLSLTGVLWPEYYSAVFRSAQPALLGELAIMLWLLIKGARPPVPDAAAPASAAG